MRDRLSRKNIPEWEASIPTLHITPVAWNGYKVQYDGKTIEVAGLKEVSLVVFTLKKLAQ